MRRAIATVLLLLAACSRGGPSEVHLPPAPSASTAVPPPAIAAAPATPFFIAPPASPHGPALGASFVADDDAHVFFNDGRGAMWSSPKDGTSPPIALAPSGLHGAFVIVGPYLYAASEHHIVRLPKAGGAQEILATEHEDPIHFATDGTWLYYTMFDGSEIRRLPLAGGTSTPVHPGIRDGAIAVDESWLYVADYRRSLLTKVAKSGGTPTTLASVPTPVGLAVDGGFAFVSCEKDGSIRRVGKSGGPAQILAKGAVNQDQIFVDERSVYWTSGGQDMAVFRVAKDGAGKPENLYAKLPSNPNQVVVDGSRVFVTTRAGVLVVPKP